MLSFDRPFTVSRVGGFACIRRLAHVLIMVVLCSIGATKVIADADGMPLTMATKEQSAAPYLSHFCESETHSMLSVEAARRMPYQPLGRSIQFGYIDEACWFRFTLSQAEAEIIQYFVTIDYALLDHIAVYLYRDDLLVSQYEFGDTVPYSDRLIDVPEYTFSDYLKQGESVEILFRIQTTSSFSAPIIVSEVQHYVESRYSRQLILGAFYGISFGLLIYNLVLFFSTRETHYLAYVFHVLAVAMFFSTVDGTSFSWWSDSLVWQSKAVNFFAYIAMGSSSIFAINFLKPRRYSIAHLALLVVTLVNILLIAGLWVFPDSINGRFLPLSGIITMPIILAVSLSRVRIDGRTALIFAFAWFLFLLMIVVVALNAVGIVNWIEESLTALKVSFVIQQLVLSFALGERINTMLKREMISETGRIKALADNEAKSAFMAKLSHEIRTPLNGVLGAAELLKQTRIDDEQKALLRTVQSSGVILLKLINDVLDFSKISADKIVLEATDFCLPDLIDDCVSSFGAELVSGDVRLHIEIDESVPNIICADSVRLQQIILNLLANAFKFTERGNIHLRVMANAADQRLYCEVLDCGIGISEQQQGRLFEPFEQADLSTTRKFGGTGLGLTIAKQLVELMGGEIGVESALSQGSMFWFYVPYQLPYMQAATPEQEQDDQVKNSIGLKPILVAEDNIVNQQVIAALLKNLGYQTHLVVNGEEAITAYCESPDEFACILMDCDMPVCDGLEATRKIRAWEQAEQQRPVNIIALTAHALAEYRVKCLDAGMNNFLTKPIQLDQLKKLL